MLTLSFILVNITLVSEMRQKGGMKKLVNVNKLKGKIVERGLSIPILAEKIGIDKATLYRKIGKNGDTITIHDADMISDELKLTRNEVNDIFFSQYVSEMRQ